MTGLLMNTEAVTAVTIFCVAWIVVTWIKTARN